MAGDGINSIKQQGQKWQIFTPIKLIGSVPTAP